MNFVAGTCQSVFKSKRTTQIHKLTLNFHVKTRLHKQNERLEEAATTLDNPSCGFSPGCTNPGKGIEMGGDRSPGLCHTAQRRGEQQGDAYAGQGGGRTGLTSHCTSGFNEAPTRKGDGGRSWAMLQSLVHCSTTGTTAGTGGGGQGQGGGTATSCQCRGRTWGGLFLGGRYPQILCLCSPADCRSFVSHTPHSPFSARVPGRSHNRLVVPARGSVVELKWALVMYRRRSEEVWYSTPSHQLGCPSPDSPHTIHALAFGPCKSADMWERENRESGSGIGDAVSSSAILTSGRTTTTSLSLSPSFSHTPDPWCWCRSDPLSARTRPRFAITHQSKAYTSRYWIPVSLHGPWVRRAAGVYCAAPLTTQIFFFPCAVLICLVQCAQFSVSRFAATTQKWHCSRVVLPS